ncbi:MAG: M23 family metallopeptidase [Deltaproteobacteria bacterium]|nr:M23 family metallopeptidase [Deltaproteobacteria bacterium]
MRIIALLLALLALTGCESLAARFNPPPDAAQPPPPPPPPPPAPPVDPLAAAGLEKVSFTVSGPLEDAIRMTAASDIAAPLAQVTARLLVWWVDVQRGLRKGDTLDVVFQRVPNREPLVHALRFNSGKNAQEYQAYLYKSEGSRFGRYYDAKGAEVEERLEGGPIDEYEQVTSMLRDGRKHKGVDFKAPVGTPVKIPFDATLTRKNWSFRGNGNCLEFRDRQGRRIVFLHLAEIPHTLRPGQNFKAGQVVAASGNTGRSTAPHLHYQLEAPNGKLLDPFKMHPLFHARLEGAQLAAYQAARDQYDRMISFVPGALPVAAAAAPAAAPATEPSVAAPAAETAPAPPAP